MNPQDIILAVCNLIFLPSLLPMIFAPISQKPPLISSLPTSFALYVMSFTFMSISLNFSFAMSFLSATAWLILSIQRIKFLRLNN